MGGNTWTWTDDGTAMYGVSGSGPRQYDAMVTGWTGHADYTRQWWVHRVNLPGVGRVLQIGAGLAESPEAARRMVEAVAQADTQAAGLDRTEVNVPAWRCPDA